jgi:hypothetical protein
LDALLSGGTPAAPLERPRTSTLTCATSHAPNDMHMGAMADMSERLNR